MTGVRVLPLTDGQRQLWFESQMGDEAALAYLESSSAHLAGTLDEAALLRAIQALVDRHDTLRMTFGRDGDVQRIHPRMKVEVARADFRGAAPRDRDARVEAWLRETVRRPFDLSDGPLVRFALAALERDEHLLVIHLPPRRLDGWSSGVVWADLGELYDAFREGRPPALAPRPDHAALVRSRWRRCGGTRRPMRSGRGSSRTASPCWSCRPTGPAPRCAATPASAPAW